jgi:dTDP-4-amino-4,6-dideoxygalactose transaminase
MDLELIKAPPAAIIATSIFGHPVDLEKLKELRAKWPQVPILQDCCHSYDAKHKGVSVMDVGVASFFALNISKIINSVFGGMVLTDDPEIHRKLREFQKTKLKKPSRLLGLKRALYVWAAAFAFQDWFYGITKRLAKAGWLNRFVRYYDESKIDMPGDYLTAMTEVQARVGLVQLTKYDHIIEIRRKCARYYDESLTSIKEVILPPLDAGATYSHYVIRCGRARELIEFCFERGVELGEIIEYNVGDMKPYETSPTQAYPVARSFLNQTVNLPVCELSDAIKTVKLVREFFGVT